MNAAEISKYIIAKFDNLGDLLTNKKLQKILYYTEAWALVHIDSIIDEDFEAWVHGPVIPGIYHEYKKFGYSPIRIEYEKGVDSSKFINNFIKEYKLNNSIIDLIDAVIVKYGVLSSQELELLSHSEKPWQEARKDFNPFDHCSEVIDKSIIKSYYSSLIS